MVDFNILRQLSLNFSDVLPAPAFDTITKIVMLEGNWAESAETVRVGREEFTDGSD